MREDRFNKTMARQKAAVDAGIAAADKVQSLVLLLTGEGKGKSTSAFGMIMRALGYGQQVAVVQFIKGTQASGEELYLRQHHPDVPLIQMATGFTWDSQNFTADQQAARNTWEQACHFLQSDDLDLLVLDELTYMLAYSFLDEQQVISAISGRSRQLSVVITGRGGGTELRHLADTVSEVKNIKHAYEQGIRALPGVDF